MKNLYITFLAIFLATFSSFAKEYTSAEIDAIIKENASLKTDNEEYTRIATDAVNALRENLNMKTALKKAGLSIDNKTSKLKIFNGEAFMTACNVVIFTEEEFEALSQNKANMENDIPQKNAETDFREAGKSDYSEKSKNFWKNVIY